MMDFLPWRGRSKQRSAWAQTGTWTQHLPATWKLGLLGSWEDLGTDKLGLIMIGKITIIVGKALRLGLERFVVVRKTWTSQRWF